MSAPTSSTDRAAETVTWLIAQMRAAEQEWYDISSTSYVAHQMFGSVAHALVGTPMREPFNPMAITAGLRRLPRGVPDEILMGVNSVAARLLWQQTRVTYAVDPDLLAELGKGDPSDKMPPELFSRLPHPNPFIAFPEPIELPINDGSGDRQRVVGFFVHGQHETNPDHINYEMVERPNEARSALHHRSESAPCSTMDDRTDGLALSFAGISETADGKPIVVREGSKTEVELRDITWTHTSLTFSDGDTFGDLVEGSLARFNRTRVSVGFTEPALEMLITRAIGLLVYLCCENADLRPLPAVAGRPRGKGGRGKSKPPKVVTVGYHVGQKLRAYRRQIREAGEPTGPTLSPHIRRAHMHTFRCGPGRKQVRLRWLHPIMVNFGDDEAKKVTVVPLTKR